MNIAFVSRFDVHDRQARSGVPYSIFHALGKDNVVTWVKPSYNGWESFQFLLFKMARKMGRWLRYELPEENPWIARIKSAAVSRQLEAHPEFEAVVSTHLMYFSYIRTKLPIFVRTDTIFPSTVGYTNIGLPALNIKWQAQCERMALQRVTHVFAASQWMSDEALRYYPKELAQKFIFVPTGANLDEDSIRYSPRYYAVGKKLNMLFVGYDIHKKGISFAYEAMRALNDQFHQPAMLTVVGGKPDEGMLRDEDVDYVGLLDKNVPSDYERFYQHFETADLFIFPTRTEYHGIVNCEAAAYGLPIFATQTGGVPSYARDGINGYTLPLSASGTDFAKRIYQCLQDGTMERLSMGSRRLYEQSFNWESWLHTVTPIIQNKISK